MLGAMGLCSSVGVVLARDKTVIDIGGGGLVLTRMATLAASDFQVRLPEINLAWRSLQGFDRCRRD